MPQFFITINFGSSACLMYILPMMRIFLTVMGIFILGATAGAEQAGGPLAPAPKSPLRHTPLFSVPGPLPHDSASPPPAVFLKDTCRVKGPADKELSHSSDSQAAEPNSVAPARPSQGAPSEVAASGTVNSLVSPAAKNSFPKSTNPRKTTAGRRHGLGAMFDLRYGVLLLSIIIIGLFLRYALKKANQPTFVTTTRLSIMDKEVQTACRYIEKNYKNPELSLETLCEALITGKAFLDALFRQELGLGVEEFIDHVRINRARMLIEKDASLDTDTAARETGFNDPGTFSDAFISIVGMAFNEYRDARAKNVA
jgi:AraC-like DNA-binding protein